MRFEDLGLMPYRQAWQVQEEIHDQVLNGGEERVLLVEHPPVITFGRRPGVAPNLLASDEQLARLGVEVVQSDRGGDITFHGPGQIVAYPIIRLNDHRLSVSGYVHALERIVVAALADFDIAAHADPKAVGVWTGDNGIDAKICALGVRIKRGVSLHGIALNVETNLAYFDLIVPCGLVGRPVTSVRKVLGERSPSVGQVKNSLRSHLHSLHSRDSSNASR
ncbi:MAG TPA: lipoyl(octanoyl) transferase LipB [Tepidisphaeraceae bacterium]|nr:lipoyl(octanoyl) transferase LipB [Tepidisphaeraceae bacterium]